MDFYDRSVAAVTGLAALVFGLYLLIFPAVGVLVLTDGYHFRDPVSLSIAGASLFAITGLITAEIIVAAALLQTAHAGAWPGRRFLLGPPAVAIIVAAFAVTGLLTRVM